MTLMARLRIGVALAALMAGASAIAQTEGLRIGPWISGG